MLTDFQHRKIRHFFSVLDADHDGHLERSDLERWAANVASVRGAKPGSPDYDHLHELWMFTWDALDKVADENHDELVSLDEWLRVTDRLLDTEEGYRSVMDAIGLKTFDVLDTDGDGHLSHEDWTNFYRALELDEAAADRVFPLFDSNGDGQISRDETMVRLREFFCSDDADAPGNDFFGPLPEG